MSMSWKRANDTLSAVLVTPGTPFLMLHLGDPGNDGTANEAQKPGGGDIDRKAVTFVAPAAHGVNEEQTILNTVAVEWSGAEIADSQLITHFSIWGAVTADQPEFIAGVDVPKTTGSDGVTIGIGDLEVAIGVYLKEP